MKVRHRWWSSMEKLLEEFRDVFPKDVPYRLPSSRGIEQHIDLTIIATLLNWVEGWVRESISSCVMPMIRVPKKMALIGYSLIVDPLIVLLLDIDNLFPIWMTCKMNCMVPKYFLKLI
ncbi:hypothetical protein CR513_32788, partial [Mucuna pruriens]